MSSACLAAGIYAGVGAHDRAGAGRANHGGQAKHWLFRRAPRTTRTTHNGISWTGAPTCACLSVPGACRTRRNGRRAHTRALTGRAHGLSSDGRGRCATRSQSPRRQRLSPVLDRDTLLRQKPLKQTCRGHWGCRMGGVVVRFERRVAYLAVITKLGARHHATAVEKAIRCRQRRTADGQ
jgi:hypothetical protein